MQLIETFEQYREIVSEGKQIPGVYSNCYFLPSAVRGMIDRGALYVQHIKNGILLLEREETFFRCYYYLSPDIVPEPVVLPMPAVVEFVFQNELTDAQCAQINCLGQMGFSLGRESARMSLPAEGAPIGDESPAEIAEKSDLTGVLKLIEDHFDPLFAYICSEDELAEAIQNGRVFVIRRGAEPVAALHAECNKGVASIRHLVVSEDCRSMGYGRRLVWLYHKAFKEKARSFSHWLDRQNAAAVRLYTGLGYSFDGRYANEYILK